MPAGTPVNEESSTAAKPISNGDRRFSTVEMAVLGGVLGALLLLALIALTVLVHKHYGHRLKCCSGKALVRPWGWGQDRARESRGPWRAWGTEREAARPGVGGADGEPGEGDGAQTPWPKQWGGSRERQRAEGGMRDRLGGRPGWSEPAGLWLMAASHPPLPRRSPSPKALTTRLSSPKMRPTGSPPLVPHPALPRQHPQSPHPQMLSPKSLRPTAPRPLTVSLSPLR